MNGDQGILVMFNRESDDFSLQNEVTRQDANWVRVASLFDDAMSRQMRGDSPEEAYERGRGIRHYKVSVVTMLDHSFDGAGDAFTRISSLGLRLNPRISRAQELRLRSRA